MHTLNVADWVQVAIFAATMAILAMKQANRWAVANHRDALATITAAGINAAGRVQAALRELPPDVDAGTLKLTLATEEAQAILAEFDRTGPMAKATVEKVAGIIMGQIGLLPAAAASAAGADAAAPVAADPAAAAPSPAAAPPLAAAA